MDDQRQTSRLSEVLEELVAQRRAEREDAERGDRPALRPQQD